MKKPRQSNTCFWFTHLYRQGKKSAGTIWTRTCLIFFKLTWLTRTCISAFALFKIGVWSWAQTTALLSSLCCHPTTWARFAITAIVICWGNVFTVFVVLAFATIFTFWLTSIGLYFTFATNCTSCRGIWTGISTCETNCTNFLLWR